MWLWARPPWRRAVVPLVLAACAAPGDDTAGGTGALPEATCEPLSITLTEEWLDTELPSIADRSHTPAGVALGDIDGDGWLDALMAYGGGAIAFRNDGAGGLVQAPEWSLPGEPLPQASSAAILDLDGDGDNDLYLGREYEQEDLILWNDGTAHFVGEVIPGSTSATTTGSFADWDGDSDLDFFLASTATATEGMAVINGDVEGGEGCMFYLQEDGAFVDATSRLPQDILHGWTFQGAPLDVDGDDDLDIYMTNDFGAWFGGNELLINDGTGTFTKAEECYCNLEMFGMGAAVGDANGDALPDLFLTDVGPPNLLINDGNRAFYDATAALGAMIPATPNNLTSWGTAFVDLDQDAWIDIVATYGQLGQPETVEHLDDQGEGWVDGPDQPDVLLLGSPDGFARADVGWNDPARTRAVAIGDLDRDGRPDMMTAGKYFLRQWKVEGGCAPGVRVTTDAGGGNRHGIGSRVQVHLGDRVLTQWMLPSTTASSNAPELYFGLGGAAAADRVVVTWPDGTTSEVGGAAAGETVAFEK